MSDDKDKMYRNKKWLRKSVEKSQKRKSKQHQSAYPATTQDNKNDDDSWYVNLIKFVDYTSCLKHAHKLTNT